jgi:hypothetical protein
MREQKQETKQRSPWAAVQTAVWLIGLAILAWQNWWWPGILVLLAISGVTQALITRFAPPEPEAALQPASSAVDPAAALAPTPPGAPAEHRLELLPAECPKCGGPIRGHEVRWTGPQSADCPYCGANLPMAK